MTNPSQSQPPLRDLASQRQWKDLAGVLGPLVMVGVVYGVLITRVDALEANLRGMQQTQLAVARLDTEIKYIKEGLARVESAENEHHQQVLKTLHDVQQELRYIRVRESNVIPPTIKGLLPQPEPDVSPTDSVSVR